MNVPREKTPLTAADLLQAYGYAWPEAIGGDPPSREALLVLVAHSAFETVEWKGMFNWNLGNIRHTANDGHDYYTVRCMEVIGGSEVWDDACQFRAYPDLTSSAREHLTFLHKRYPQAWAYALAGDPDGFAHALKRQGYYTGDENAYAAGVSRYFRKFSGNPGVPIGAVNASGARSVSPLLIAAAGLVVGGWAYIAWTKRRQLQRMAFA